jgi:hypothetical protein
MDWKRLTHPAAGVKHGHYGSSLKDPTATSFFSPWLKGFYSHEAMQGQPRLAEGTHWLR